LIAILLLAVNLQAAELHRIVSTAPSITETLFAMGLGPRVVGVTVYCKYPPEAAKLPKIGGLVNPDVETIVALKPDLVVVQKHPNRLVEELGRLHIAAVEVDNENLKDIYQTARAIGYAAGVPAAAEQLVNRMQSELGRLQSLTAGKPQPTAVFLIGSNSGRLEGLIAGSGTSSFSELLTFAGARNIFADVTARNPRISLEEILARDPDVIIQISGDTDEQREAVRARWRQHRELRAVRNGRIYAIPSSPFDIPGPRVVDGVRMLIPLLHPDVHP
jgi:iron complex transport system substrate-binding protein